MAAALAEGFPREWPPAVIEIASAPGGVPYARLAAEAGPAAGFAPGDPLPVAVSISHAEGRALCAARLARVAGSGRGLGADLGRVEPRSAAFAETFLADEERRWVGEALGADGGLRANLVWCAKEAVLKALGVGLTVDTRDLTCLPAPGEADPAEWPLAPPDAGWRPFAATCAPGLLPAGETVHGIWRAFPGFAGALASVGRGTVDTAGRSP